MSLRTGIRGIQGAASRLRRSRSILLVGAGLCLVATAPVEAEMFDYTATLDLHVGTVEPFRLEASGQLTVNPDGSFTFPAGVFATSRTLIPPQTTYEAVASIGLQLANGAGIFRGPGDPGGAMRLTGQAVFNLQPFFGFDPLTLEISPLGGTGSATVMGSNGATQLTATLTGAPWQTGVFQQTGSTSLGSTFTRRTNTGQDLRTSAGEGVVTLVVPAYITTRVDGSFSDRSPVTAVLGITLVPEPTQLIGEGAAIAVLLLLGGWRLRQRRIADGGGAQLASQPASSRTGTISMSTNFRNGA